MNRKQLNEEIAQILMHLSGALQAESIRGATAFIARADRVMESLSNRMALARSKGEGDLDA